MRPAVQKIAGQRRAHILCGAFLSCSLAHMPIAFAPPPPPPFVFFAPPVAFHSHSHHHYCFRASATRRQLGRASTRTSQTRCRFRNRVQLTKAELRCGEPPLFPSSQAVCML